MQSSEYIICSLQNWQLTGPHDNVALPSPMMKRRVNGACSIERDRKVALWREAVHSCLHFAVKVAI
jgi:hypothetical protein